MVVAGVIFWVSTAITYAYSYADEDIRAGSAAEPYAPTAMMI